jgi:hypothetical protein
MFLPVRWLEGQPMGSPRISGPDPAPGTRQRSRAVHSRPVLLFAFAFAVMADPVSSVAYAIEAALRALRGDLALLLPTMGLVVCRRRVKTDPRSGAGENGPSPRQ